ncbi:serine/threonine-protein kinase [Pseudonocardia endophytica]|uniref:non-specific serine/threonine protein kinase n=1 Tax=Pseudonocardia endophytica TaxID=401976 RepID=A0A4R1I0B8_PSEEN|nr:serine/threonine-protein kinase [Pseudonocardia endophytica]TCK27291.1 serine/threonine protein kinase [Pseudonocardia endophytica]
MGPGDQLFGRYRIVRWIAAGGMGTVWEAHDEALDQTVALKHVGFSGAPADAEANRRRTLREARNAAQLRREPDVVAIYDVRERDGDVWLVLEYLPSRSLAQVLEGGERIEPAVAAGVGAAVARALAAAHARGITHRDVKPGNVLIAAADGAAKLTDFGISHAEGDPALTATGLLSGTPAFMAPEVARGDDSTAAADVFSLGATLYAAVEGQPPFGHATNPRALIQRVAHDPVPPPVRAGALTPVLQQMLAPDPAQRPFAATVVRLLQDPVQGPTPSPATVPVHGVPGGGHPGGPYPAHGHGGPTAWGSGVPTPVPGPPPAQRRRYGRWILAAVAVAALVAGAGFAGARLSGTAAPAPAAAPAAAAPALPVTVGPITISGDPRLVDACRLIDPGSMRRFGDVELDSATMPQGCGLRLNSGTDRYAYLDVQFSNADTTDPDGSLQQIGDIGVRRGSRTDDEYATPECTRRVVLTDGTSLLVRVQSSAASPPPLCDVAETATVSVVTRLAGSGVPYDAQRNARFSLVRTDACSLLQTAEVVPVVGAGPGRFPGFGAWNCTWRPAGDADANVMVSLNGGDADPTGYGDAITVSGREAFQQPATGGCQVTVVHRAAPSPTERSELLQVAAFKGGGDATALCTTARNLATAAENRAGA